MVMSGQTDPYDVNPTYVGMDLKTYQLSPEDDPSVNPTYVGMDRQSQHISALLNGKPHARGDEP